MPRIAWTPERVAFHLALPQIIAGYVQLAVNAAFAAAAIGWTAYFSYVLQRDLRLKTLQHGEAIAAQVRACRSSYTANNCAHVAGRLPAMQALCSEWEACLLRSPDDVVSLQAFAEMFSETLNRAVDPLSYKTLAFLCVMAVVLVALNVRAPARTPGPAPPEAAAPAPAPPKSLSPARAAGPAAGPAARPLPLPAPPRPLPALYAFGDVSELRRRRPAAALPKVTLGPAADSSGAGHVSADDLDHEMQLDPPAVDWAFSAGPSRQ